MRVKVVLAILGLCLASIFLAGCYHTITGTVKGAADGFAQDWKNAEKIDAWMRKNLW